MGIAKIRPQVMVAIAGLISVGILSAVLGHIEITSGCVGGLIAIGTRLTEKNGDDE